jgi:ankyrin repeat protein
LSRAAEKGDEAVVQLLLEYGARPDLRDEDGLTPLLRAIEIGSAAVVQLLLITGVKMDYNYRAVSESDYKLYLHGSVVELWLILSFIITECE